MPKKCSKCDFECDLNTAKEYFPKDSTKCNGYASQCKKCKAKYDEKRLKGNRYKDFEEHVKNKHRLRASAKKMKKESEYCSVIGCKVVAELHHIDYKSNDSVVPLCRKHHSKIHTLENHLEFFLNSQSDQQKTKNDKIQELESLLKEACEMLDKFQRLSQIRQTTLKTTSFLNKPEIQKYRNIGI